MKMPVLVANGKNILVSRYQTAPEIAAAIVKAIQESKTDALKLAPYLKSGNKITSARLIFIFLKNTIPYKKEASTKQTARTLARLLNEASLGGDCKHFATASAALCSALNIKCKLRLIAQGLNTKIPNHIYTIATINGTDYIIDPVLKNFDTEARYNYKYDIKIN
jgi:hypothetical protein